ncbi:hypothetical protein Q4595_10555 [Wenyingzhuangia sp. 1_MG-2023]|nr:hypothetical protein [Wenyingzhuangia sp. 1_MG-2023]
MLFLILSLLFIISCSDSEKGEKFDLETKNKLLTSVINGQTEDCTPQINFAYKEGLLQETTSCNQGLIFNGKYTYDENLLSYYEFVYRKYSFFYSNNKLTSVHYFRDRPYVRDTLNISYENNIIKTTLNHDINGFKTELTLNEENKVTMRVIKYMNPTKTNDTLHFSYDTNGNIDKIINITSNNSKTWDFKYTTIRNPYFETYNKLYNGIYLTLFSGYSLDFEKFDDHYGLSPFLIQNDSFEYEINKFNLPIKKHNLNDNSIIEFFYEE